MRPPPATASDFALYPGCCAAVDPWGRQAMQASTSLCQALGIRVADVPGWHCCGGHEWAGRWPVAAAALAMHNLSLAGTRQVNALCLCPTCAEVMQRAIRLSLQQPGLGERIGGALSDNGLLMPGGARAAHLLEVLDTPSVRERIRAGLRRPLRGMRVACYHGCKLGDLDGVMERLVACVGGEVVEIPGARECCRAHAQDGASGVCALVMQSAEDAGAQLVASSCPRCTGALRKAHSPAGSLESLPVVFFAQLLAGALGLPARQAGLRVSRQGRGAVVRARLPRQD